LKESIILCYASSSSSDDDDEETVACLVIPEAKKHRNRGGKSKRPAVVSTKATKVKEEAVPVGSAPVKNVELKRPNRAAKRLIDAEKKAHEESTRIADKARVDAVREEIACQDR
jgi:hypothetical protein